MLGINGEIDKYSLGDPCGSCFLRKQGSYWYCKCQGNPIRNQAAPLSVLVVDVVNRSLREDYKMKENSSQPTVLF